MLFEAISIAFGKSAKFPSYGCEKNVATDC